MIEFVLNAVKCLEPRGLVFLGVLLVAVLCVNVKTYWEKKETYAGDIGAYFRGETRLVLLSALVFYIGGVCTLTLVARNQEGIRNWKGLIPFWSWRAAYLEFSAERNERILEQIIYNVLVFVPVGSLLYGLKKLTMLNGFALGAVLSLPIEVLQLTFRLGLFEWDDVLHNAIGCMLGVWLGRLFYRVRAGNAQTKA